MSFLAGLWAFLERRKLWLVPLIVISVIFIGLAVVTKPFLYQPQTMEWLNRPSAGIK